MSDQHARRRQLQWIILTALLLASAACTGVGQPLTWQEVERRIQEEFPGVPHITTAGLAARLADSDLPVVLLDARTVEEYAVSHLPDAALTPTVPAAQQVIRNAPPNAVVVVYCSVGYRSAQLVEALRAQGHATVVNLRGSLFAWANEGRPIVQDERPVQHVHPYDRTWGVLLDRALWSFNPGS